MRSLQHLARVLTLSLIVTQTMPHALAQAVSIDNIVENPHIKNWIDARTDSSSYNHLQIQQNAETDAVQEATVDGTANTQVDANQNMDVLSQTSITQECETGSGSNDVCIEEAGPTIVHEVMQQINALSQNDMGIDQSAGSGSTQKAAASGSALATVDAVQMLTTETIVDIFQDCSKATGVCIQRAIPDVLNRAQQVIAATALNNLDSKQEAEDGALQEARADLDAIVDVYAEQVINTRAFIRLRQICAMDVGLCIQRATPMVQTAVEQVVDAIADNTASIVQDGAEHQIAAVDTTALTKVTTKQTVNTQTTLDVLQSCSVTQGLCLQVDSNGNPVFIFSDGETTQTGNFTGTLDETQLQNDYSRASVAQTVGGICGEAGTCSMLDQLLVWLFGPEATQHQAPAAASSNERGSMDTTSARRGHSTNVLEASLAFMSQNGDVAPAAFGGKDATAAAYTSLFCSVRKQLLAEDRDPGLWKWTADKLSDTTGVPSKDILARLRDPFVCPHEIVEVKAMMDITVFPIASDGPVSSNALWNKCLRGSAIVLEDVRANPDRDEHDRPRDCGSYHTGESWYHPDLNIYFTWNRFTGELIVPTGYLPMAQ